MSYIYRIRPKQFGQLDVQFQVNSGSLSTTQITPGNLYRDTKSGQLFIATTFGPITIKDPTIYKTSQEALSHGIGTAYTDGNSYFVTSPLGPIKVTSSLKSVQSTSSTQPFLQTPISMQPFLQTPISIAPMVQPSVNAPTTGISVPLNVAVQIPSGPQITPTPITPTQQAPSVSPAIPLVPTSADASIQSTAIPPPIPSAPTDASVQPSAPQAILTPASTTSYAEIGTLILLLIIVITLILVMRKKHKK